MCAKAMCEAFHGKFIVSLYTHLDLTFVTCQCIMDTVIDSFVDNAVFGGNSKKINICVVKIVF